MQIIRRPKRYMTLSGYKFLDFGIKMHIQFLLNIRTVNGYSTNTFSYTMELGMTARKVCMFCVLLFGDGFHICNMHA